MMNSIKRLWIVSSIFTFSIFSSYSQDRSFNMSDVSISLDDLNSILTRSNLPDTVFIKAGIHKNSQVVLRAKPSKKIVIIAEEPGKVVFSDRSSVTIENSENIQFEGFLFNQIKSSSSIILNNSSNIDIKNNFFYQCGSSRFGFIIRIDRGSHDNRLSYNTFDGSRAMSIVVALRVTNMNTKKNVNNEIFNNYFVNIPSVKSIYPDSDGNGLEAIQLGQGKETASWNLNTKIFNNLFENIIGDGGEIISVKSSGNAILSNTFLNNKSGITLRIGNDIKVKGNYLKNTTRGIRVFGKGHTIENNYIEGGNVGFEIPSANVGNGEKLPTSGYFQAEDILFKGNFVKGTKIAIFLIGNGGRKLDPKNITIESNKFISNSETDLFKIDNPSFRMDSFTLKNNVDFSKSVVGRLLNNIIPTEFASVTPLLVTGNEPFKKNDLKVGATWKRP